MGTYVNTLTEFRIFCLLFIPKAQWQLCVPPTANLRDCFLPHGEFMCLLIRYRTAVTISLYNVRGLVLTKYLGRSSNSV